MHQPRILVVDDDVDYLELVRTTIDQAGFIAVPAKSGAEALEQAAAEAPTVALIDVQLPGLSGYEVSRELWNRHRTPTIFVSGHRTEPADRVAGLMLGALDYIVKPFDPGELIARLRRALRADTTNGGGALERLTPREHEILQFLVDGRTPNEVADALVIAPKTVATHVQRILDKLGVHARSAAISAAVAAGMRPRV